MNTVQGQVHQQQIEPLQVKYLASIASEAEKNIQYARNQLKLQKERLVAQQQRQRHV